MIKDKITYLIRRYRIYLERGKSIPALSLTTTTCKHCGTEYRGNYCPRCGQSHKAGSYRNKKMYKTFREAYPMLSNAFFRTIIELITRPGYMIRDYFRGHQVIYLGPVTTLVVAISCITICGHIYDEIELSSFPKKEITQPQVDSSGKTEKEIYKKWGLTITSKDDGRMDNGVVAAIWRVFREKLEDDTTLFLFAIFPMYGLAARRAFKKCKFVAHPLTVSAHYMTFVYLYALHALIPLPIPVMLFYLVWTYRGIYGMKWIESTKHVAFTTCWSALYLAALLSVLALIGVATVYIINYIFYT